MTKVIVFVKEESDGRTNILILRTRLYQRTPSSLINQIMTSHRKFHLLVSFFCICTVAGAAPNTTLEQVLCNGNAYTAGDPFSESLEYVMSDLESVTPSKQGYDYYDISPYPNAFAYGHATCNKNLTTSDCSSCLGASATSLFLNCERRIGGRCALRDCSVRYEQYPFYE